jgi:large repetitive protein
MENYFAVIRSDASQPTCTVTGVENGTPSVTPPAGSQQLSAGQTSTSFGGLSANQTYTIWVFASNNQGCTSAAPVQVTPRAVPGPVGSITTSIAPNGAGDEFSDIRLTAFGISSGSTDADTFVFRFTSGADGTQSAILPLGSFLTAGTSQYGNATTVQVKACRAYPEATLCSTDWSADFPTGVPVRNSTPGNLEHVSELLGDNQWRWTSIPSGPAYTAVEYRCDNGNGPDGWAPMPATGTCDTLLADLRVRISVGELRYIRSYSTFDY